MKGAAAALAPSADERQAAALMPSNTMLAGSGTAVEVPNPSTMPPVNPPGP